MDEKINLLRLVPIFRDLTNVELERIWDIAIQRNYDKKAIVFTEGSEKEAVFFILDGLIKAYKTDENGNEHIVSFLKTGEMFPHTGFFDDSLYPATTEAIVESQLLAIPIQAFDRLIIKSPEIAVKVMRALSEKIVQLQQKLQEITGHDVQDRGQLFLIKLAENYGYHANGNIHIDVPMTHQEFASTIGTTRETVNRLLNQLRKAKVIETSRKGFTILDFERLKNWHK